MIRIAATDLTTGTVTCLGTADSYPDAWAIAADHCQNPTITDTLRRYRFGGRVCDGTTEYWVALAPPTGPDPILNAVNSTAA